MLSHHDKTIKDAIQHFENAIKLQEKIANPEGLIHKLHLYDYAKDMCAAAKELVEDARKTLSDHDKIAQYDSISTILHKATEVVVFPSQENSEDLLKYQNNLCLSKKSCSNERINKFMSCFKMFIGVAFIVSSVLSFILLPLPSVAIMFIAGFFGFSGGQIFSKGRDEYKQNDEKLLEKKHLHLTLSKTNSEKTHYFYNTVTHFGKVAGEVGYLAECRYQQIDNDKKHEILSSFMRTRYA